MAAPLLQARDLQAGYGGRVVVSLAEFALARGERVFVTGANGSGKTTVLKTLARLLPPVAGSVTGPAPGPGGAIYVHPSPFLFAGSGEHNVLLGAHGDAAAARDAIAALRAEAFASLDVRRMSNGQRQRIALARALAAKPLVVMIDEADSGLDAEGREAWNSALARNADLAVVIATHAGERIQNMEYRILSLGAP